MIKRLVPVCQLRLSAPPPLHASGALVWHLVDGAEGAMLLRHLAHHVMDKQVVQLAQQLLNGGFDKFSDRERRVLTHIAKRLHVTRNVNCAIEEKQSSPDRLADCVVRFGGS